MTAKRDLKKRIRERSARTGESYTAARRHVVGEAEQRPGGVPFIELRDLSKLAARAGIRCPVRIYPELAQRIDCAALLARIRDALQATEGDPKTEPMRKLVLRGEEPDLPWDLASDPVRDPRRVALVAARRGPPITLDPFLARAIAGIGGVSDSGRMLALPMAGTQGVEMVVCNLALSPAPYRVRRPSALLLMTPDDFFVGLDLEKLVGTHAEDSLGKWLVDWLSRTGSRSRPKKK